MSCAISNLSCAVNSTIDGLHSVAVATQEALSSTAQKIKDVVASPAGLGIIGFGLGMHVYKIYAPCVEATIQTLGMSTNLADPFSGLNLCEMILYTPLVCVIGPILEEVVFRGKLQETLKDMFQSFYNSQGVFGSFANTAARVSSLFFTSVIFGLIHLTNAVTFWCNPILFLPQVVAATVMGLVFGLAKEFSEGLSLPISMHIGNNTLAWAQYMQACL
jgi:membrane protease YdiL (CAAX protease family)